MESLEGRSFEDNYFGRITFSISFITADMRRLVEELPMLSSSGFSRGISEERSRRVGKGRAAVGWERRSSILQSWSKEREKGLAFQSFENFIIHIEKMNLVMGLTGC